MMNHSIFWARLLGLYTIILSIWTFLNLKILPALMMDLANNTAVLMTLGLFTVFLGLAIVVSHQVWRGWPILVTVVGYWIILKGSVILFFPQIMHQVVSYWQGKNMIIAPVPSLVIGLILLFCGFMLHKAK